MLRKSKLLAISMVPLLSLVLEYFAQDQRPCFEKAETQKELNECAGRDLQQAETELSRVYQKVLSKYAAYPDLLDRIKKAQDAWVSYRNAEVSAAFPDILRQEYGSSFEMCRLIYLKRLTLERTELLRMFVEASEEGDVCDLRP